MPVPEFSKVGPPYWDDRPLLIIGSGISLKGFEFNRLNGLGRILAVKEAVFDLPFADACFSLHIPWFRTRAKELPELAKRLELYFAIPKGMSEKQYDPIVPGAIYLDRVRINNGFVTDDPGKIESGANSGFGAVNLAYHKRAKLIYLFGFDYSPTAGHYCQDRYLDPAAHNARYWLNWAGNFLQVRHQVAAAGMTIINASEHSTVTAFPKVPIETALRDLSRLRSA